MGKTRNDEKKSIQDCVNEAKELFTKKEKTSCSDLLKMSQVDDLDNLFESIKSLVRKFGSSIKTAQIRNIYSKVQAAKTVTALKLLRPKLAYIAARQTNTEAKALVLFCEELIAQIAKDNNEQLESFKMFFESLVAYHKFYETLKEEK
ncbi:type III-A CRISPR-associated protein Csm2 [Bernardetia sp. MNP-M8]|uniref:type III-A CRISPR-associated protein Csm2 n=1 Tax=Bernardetia sp. MNP-M8 TaxID=3127470 RepID=UPI0030D4866C